MRFDTIIRSFMIAGLISLIAVLIEAIYFGLKPENSYSIGNTAYSITSPFVNSSSGIGSHANIILLGIIFVSCFVIVSNLISKKERSKRTTMKDKENI